jgi:5S rRNA maturation endonuclease (ribonuclease M5)
MSAHNELSTIKRTVRIVDIIRRDVILKTEGKDYIGCCPFHKEQTPSFRVYSSSERYHCFGCNAGGDVIQWLVSFKGMTVPEAKEHLTGDIGQQISQLNQSVVSIIEPDSAGWFPVMPVPEDAPAVPVDLIKGSPLIHRYLNAGGQVMMYIARYEFDKKSFVPIIYGSDNQWHKEGIPKSNRPIYGLDKLATTVGTVIVVEGEKKRDALQGMFPNNAIISWSGGSQTVEKTDWSPLLESGRKVIYWRDNDEAGLKAQNVFASICPETYVLEIPTDKCKGWDCGDAIISDKWDTQQILSFISKKVLWRDLNPIAAVEIEEVPHQEIKSSLPKHLYHAPGMIGRISKWINHTAIHPLPELELGCAIAAVGIVYAHKVRTVTDLRSNMYVMGISPSGSGKDHARKCIKSLLHAAGVQNLVGGKPKSGAAILTMAAKNDGKCLLLWDEIGRVLEGISARNSQSYQRDISTNLMELFTSSNTLFLGDELANRDGKTNRVDIDQPCFNIYATTVKDSLYAAMTSKEAVDGFLSRWLVFEAENPYIDEDHDDIDDAVDLIYDITPPQELIDEVIEWVGKPTNAYPEGRNLVQISPAVVPYSPAAQDMVKAFQKSIRLKLRDESEQSAAGQTVFAALWARAAEHANKLALCGHEGGEISASVMRWAIDVSVFCTEKMLTEIERNISDNEHEATSKRVLDIIRKNKGITKNELTRKTQWLRDSKHRDDILKTLEQSDQVKVVPDTTDTDKPRLKYYIK